MTTSQAIQNQARQSPLIAEQLSLNQFPNLFAAIESKGSQSSDRLRTAVVCIAQGLLDDSIRNPVYLDAKEVISNAVYYAWGRLINDRFFSGGRQSNSDLMDLYYSVNIMGVHDINFLPKKLAKTKATGPAVDAMRKLCDELLPLAQAIKGLKSKTVKGRAPAGEAAKPVNPNKIMKTCPCCFRQIAVVNFRMAHHGYQRPGYGVQTASCPGVNFPPLEVARDGLDWLIQYETDRQKTLLKNLKNVKQATTLSCVDRVAIDKNGHRTFVNKHITLTPNDLRFGDEKKKIILNLDNELKFLNRQIEILKNRQDGWEPEKPVDPRLVA